MKKCPTCNEIQPLINFPKDKTQKDGHKSYCFPCNRIKVNECTRKRVDKRKIENKLNESSIKLYRDEYYKNNKDKFKDNYKKNREKNPSFKIAHNTRVRINCALKNGSKSISTEKLLGCTFKEYKVYLENLFDSNMNWDNYGVYWEIDHIKQCSTFNLELLENQKLCFHFTNTQPLSKIDNQRKSKK